MESLDWLLTDADLRSITDNYESDWACEIFFTNGITTPEDAFDRFLFMRFEHYPNTDCPKCGYVDKHTKIGFELWKCNNCYLNFSLTSGTYLDNTKIEYYKWFRFCYLLGTLGLTNSMAISRDLQITQKTAWNMIESVRTARKELSDTNFKNGSDILIFESFWDVMQLLVKTKKQPSLIYK